MGDITTADGTNSYVSTSGGSFMLSELGDYIGHILEFYGLEIDGL